MKQILSSDKFDALETDLLDLLSLVRAFRSELSNHKSSQIDPRERRTWKMARSQWRIVQQKCRTLLGKRHSAADRKVSRRDVRRQERRDQRRNR